jgi:hypothetical protein
VKPANQLGSMFSAAFTIGLGTGFISGKAAFNSGDKPQFIEARILRILCKPSLVRCSLRFIISTIILNKIKSACFCVIKGYLSK